MTSVHCHSSVFGHRTSLKPCPVMMICRPFGRQFYGRCALRGANDVNAGIRLISGLKGRRNSSNRRHGQNMQVRMAVETEFPLPNLEKFLWDEMKLPDLTGTHALCTSYSVHIYNIPRTEEGLRDVVHNGSSAFIDLLACFKSFIVSLSRLHALQY